MPELPAKLRLTPDDVKRHREWVANHPENRLSPEAKLRIDKAYDAQYFMRIKAKAAVELRWQAEASDLDLGDYESKGQALIDLVETDMAAARLILQTKAEEYWKLGLPRRQFLEVMESEIDAATNSLQLRNHQKLAIETEFGALWSPPAGTSVLTAFKDEPVPPEPAENESPKQRLGRSITNPRAARRVEEYRLKRDWTYVEFGEQAQISEDTIRNLVKTERASQRIWSGLATVMEVSLNELLS